MKKLIFIVVTLCIFTVTPFTCIEVYYRLTTQDKPEQRYEKINQRPVTVTPELGMIFAPNQYTTRSNGYDYHVKQKSNKFGFLDRDHDLEKPEGVYRILFLGDSYIEAVQVAIKDKVHSILERKLNEKRMPKKVECIALGFSGFGTANQLLYYENLGKKFNPDLVVVLFIANDFMNNSPILHGINEGWYPYKAPRFFFEYDHKKNQFITVPHVLDSYKYMIPVKAPPKKKEIPLATDKWLSWSLFYKESRSVLKEYLGREEMQEKIDDIYTQRFKFLKDNYPFIKEKLEDWNYPKDLGLNTMYYAEKMPQVFEESMKLTDLCFSELKRRTAENKSKLIIASGTFFKNGNIEPEKYGRKCDPDGFFKKLKKLTDKHSIPLIDLYEEFLKRGTIEETRWRYDSHFNKTGHRWAADAIQDYIVKENLIQ